MAPLDVDGDGARADRKKALEVARAALLTLHAAVGVAWPTDRQVARMLRAAEGLARASVAFLEAPPAAVASDGGGGPFPRAGGAAGAGSAQAVVPRAVGGGGGGGKACSRHGGGTSRSAKRRRLRAQKRADAAKDDERMDDADDDVPAGTTVGDLVGKGPLRVSLRRTDGGGGKSASSGAAEGQAALLELDEEGLTPLERMRRWAVGESDEVPDLPMGMQFR